MPQKAKRLRKRDASVELALLRFPGFENGAVFATASNACSRVETQSPQLVERTVTTMAVRLEDGPYLVDETRRAALDVSTPRTLLGLLRRDDGRQQRRQGCRGETASPPGASALGVTRINGTVHHSHATTRRMTGTIVRPLGCAILLVAGTRVVTRAPSRPKLLVPAFIDRQSSRFMRGRRQGPPSASSTLALASETPLSVRRSACAQPLDTS